MVVSEYKDYRLFIREYIEKQRKSHSKYSMIFYSKKIEASDGYLKLVVSGKRSLSIGKAVLLAKIFELSPAEKSYFITLVMENEATETSVKSYFKGLLAEKNKTDFSYMKNRKLTGIFEDRLLWELFSLIGLFDFENSMKYIKSKLRLPANDSEVSAALRRLQALEAIHQDESGNLRAESIVIPHSYNPTKAYRTALVRAVKHIDTGMLGSSYFDSFCLILSDDQFNQICGTLEETKSKIAKIASQKDEKKTLIAYLNLNLFSASK